jgi:hypothetical protein
VSEFDDFSWHEAMDRAAMLADTYAHHVAEHPVIETNPELRNLADAALKAMFDLYQRLAQVAPHMKAKP